MSLLKKLGKVVKPVARAAAAYYTAGASEAVLAAAKRRPAGSGEAVLTQGTLSGLATQTAFPALGPMLGGMARMVPSLGAMGAGAVVVARSAASIGRGAVTWCRRNPAWCANIGGTAAVAALIESGQLPMPRRRRGRGLSARDLRGFRKTTRLIRQVAGSVGLRRGGKRGASSSSTLIAQN